MTRQSVTQPQTPTTHPLSGGILQRKCGSCGQYTMGGECGACEKKRMPLQRRASSQAEPTEVPPIVGEVLRSPGQPLDTNTRTFIESGFGHDFSSVRVHTNTKAATSAQAINAHAYTVGSNVVFNSGKYQPNTYSGQKLIAHELVHVVQQSGQKGFAKKSQNHLTISQQNDRYEKEADAVADSVMRASANTDARQAEAPNINPAPIGIYGQWAQAGNCWMRGETPGTIGTQVHRLLQKAMVGFYPGILFAEVFIPGSGRRTGRTLCDLFSSERDGVVGVVPNPPSDKMFPPPRGVYPPPPDAAAIGSIKPASHLTRGEYAEDIADLYDYIDSHDRHIKNMGGGFVTHPMQAPVPPQLMYPGIFLPVSSSGIPQSLHLFTTGDGMYYYFCRPIAEIIPALAWMADKMREFLKDLEKFVDIPPVPSPAPETGTQVGIAAALTAIATLVAYKARQSIQKLATRVLGATATRALAHATLAAALVLVVAYPNRVEASIDGGKSPIEALFQVMSESGVPPTPEMRQLLENDPALRQTVEEAVRTGKISDAQQQINQRLVQTIKENPNQFSEEDLKVLLTTTKATSSSGLADPSVKELQRAIERARSGQATTSDGESESTKEPISKRQSESDEDRTTSSEHRQYPGLSEQSRDTIASLPTPLRTLFDAMVGPSGTGPRVTDEFVRRFREIVPVDLTSAQSQQLIQQLQPITTQSIEEILANLERAIQQIQGSSSTESETTEGESVESEEAREVPAPETESAAGSSTEASETQGTQEQETTSPQRGSIISAQAQERDASNARSSTWVSQKITGVGSRDYKGSLVKVSVYLANTNREIDQILVIQNLEVRVIRRIYVPTEGSERKMRVSLVVVKDQFSDFGRYGQVGYRQGSVLNAEFSVR